MRLIADSGSTKTDWRLVNADGTIEQCSTKGLNPLFITEEIFLSTIKDSFPVNWLSMDVRSIYFYGAGCVGPQQTGLVQTWLHKIYQEASIHVQSDMLGAAIAVCGDQAGLVGILGTGSNSCLFDGQAIIDKVPPLGYILGDEGSGSALGKALLKGYLRGELPADLAISFEEAFGADTDFLQKVYAQLKPNEFLASFATFLGKHQKNPFVAKLVSHCFYDFLDLIQRLQREEHLTINFVGSIAYNFNGILTNAVKERGFSMGKIVQSPIAGLALHHLEH